MIVPPMILKHRIGNSLEDWRAKYKAFYPRHQAKSSGEMTKLKLRGKSSKKEMTLILKLGKNANRKGK